MASKEKKKPEKVEDAKKTTVSKKKVSDNIVIKVKKGIEVDGGDSKSKKVTAVNTIAAPPPQKDSRTKFARILFENDLTVKEIEEGCDVSYPVLIDLKNGNRDNYNPRTLDDIVRWLNTKKNLNLTVDDIVG